jgi:hypothetical protein
VEKAGQFLIKASDNRFDVQIIRRNVLVEFEFHSRVGTGSSGRSSFAVAAANATTARSREAEPDMASGSLFARYFTETSRRPVVDALVDRRPLQRFHWLLHNDIERDQEAENDGKEVDRQRSDVGCGAVLDAC